MPYRPHALVAAALVSIGTAALADDKPAAPPEAAKMAAASGPAAELAALDFLSGAFSCTGTWHSDTGAVVAKQSKFHAGWKLDKHFLEFSYEQPKSKEQPNHIAAIGYFGWEGGTKKYVHNATRTSVRASARSS